MKAFTAEIARLTRTEANLTGIIRRCLNHNAKYGAGSCDDGSRFVTQLRRVRKQRMALEDRAAVFAT